MGKRDHYDAPGWGWFALEGRQKGDRTLAEQMIGLERLRGEAPGRSVLDLGAAEGLIALELLKAGATLAHGIEFVASRVALGQQLAAQAGLAERLRLEQGDLQDFAGRAPCWLLPAYDLVLLLSIAHKLRDPAAFLRAAARRTAELLAVRLPRPVIVDARSRHRPCDVSRVLAEEGFRPPRTAIGPRGEWVGLYERA